MSQRIKWSIIEPHLASLPKPALLKLLKELFEASDDNEAFFATRFLNASAQASALEPYRERIVHQFFPSRGDGNLDLREARQAIRDYRRATSDITGTVDLMLIYVENGTRFTNTFGDIEESFYNSMESVLGEAVKLLRSKPELYTRFRDRLKTLARETRGIGWGYGDAVGGMVNELVVRSISLLR